MASYGVCFSLQNPRNRHALKKFFLFAGIALVAILSFALVREMPDAHSSPPTEVHGELIQPGAQPDLEITNQQATKRRRHPKPPSVQVRMVMTELAPSDAPASGGAMPSGTLGTAADLRKTNLVSASSLPPISEDRFGCPELSFQTLSDFDMHLKKELAEGGAGSSEAATEIRHQIPANIQMLDGKKAVIQGFLLPVKMNNGLAVEFLLLRNQSMCCYGVPPRINEWITVRMTGKGVKPLMDQPIAVVGTLHVRPTQENGFLASIYDMDGDKVIEPF